MLFRRDVRRLIKSSYIVVGSLFAVAVFALLSLLISNEINIGISVFGNLTSFTDGESILRNAADYTKGMGLLLSVLISVFVGKEYQYRTWQHLFSHGFRRKNVYLEKLATSVLLAVSLYLCSGITIYAVFRITGSPMLTGEKFASLLLHGALLYSMLAAIICCISILVKNPIASLLLSISFVLFESAFVKTLGYVAKLCRAERLYAIFAKTTLYGMNEMIRSSESFVSSIVVSTVFWISLVTAVGILCFRRYEI